jgi:hypothetical protein
MHSTANKENKTMARGRFDTQLQMVEFADQYAGQFSPNEAGFADPYALQWQLNRSFPIDLLDSEEEWVKWFAEEEEILRSCGIEHRYDYLKEADYFYNPVVVVYLEGEYHLWDGNHRIGVLATKGIKTVFALVGARY